MIYHIETTPQFDREFKKLDKSIQRLIKAWIDKNLTNTSEPCMHGKSLSGDKIGQWRYRIGDYRMLCEIQDDKLIILALSVGHRSKIYS